jgi:hypothetical protein
MFFLAPSLVAPFPLNRPTLFTWSLLAGGSMRIPNHPTYLLRMWQHRRKQLATSSPVRAAALGTYTHRGGRPTCRGHHGGPRHTAPHLTFKEHGKTRSVSVPKALLPEIRTWLAEHQRLNRLLREIHQLSVALLRARARLQKRKAGRP